MKRRIRKKREYPKRRLPLDERHMRALSLLSDIPRKNYEEIAAELGIDRRTLYRWRARTDFERELRKEIDRGGQTL